MKVFRLNCLLFHEVDDDDGGARGGCGDDDLPLENTP